MDFSIRVSRTSTINGRLLASMTQADAIKHFKKSRFTEDQIKKAHSEAKAKVKELDVKDSSQEVAE